MNSIKVTFSQRMATLLKNGMTQSGIAHIFCSQDNSMDKKIGDSNKLI